MASARKSGSGVLEKSVNRRRSSKHKEGPIVMDTKAVFTALYDVCEENAAFFSGATKGQAGDTAQRLVDTMSSIQEHARSLEPIISGFAAIYHHFDFDPHIPANGYRSLVKVVRCCLLHIIHKGRYITSNRRSIFFRASHNAAEMEAYCSALCQLRALLYLAQRLLHDNSHGNLFFQEESGISQSFLREYASMHKGCFYGRCVGFQFTPAIRPFLQSIAISLVAFGVNYKKHQSGIGVAASSFLTSGKYAIDPDLRGQEYERITQNLDVHFWKRFWNITETEVLSDSEKLLALCRSEGGPISLSLGLKTKRSPPSPWLVLHFHGGGFVAQTSKSHEPYLRSWSQDLNAPILSVDYSLAPEAPFPRALEECFYAYCWAIKNHNLLGWTGERVCLAGDSAGGNLCVTVSMRAAAHGVRMPDGIVAAYPATLLTVYASPSRLLSLMDPLLPLSVLARCLSAYAGTDPRVEKQVEKVSTLSMVRSDTALLLRDFRQGASNWIHSLLDRGSADSVRKSVSEATLTSPHTDPPVSGKASEYSLEKGSLKSQTCQDLGTHANSGASNVQKNASHLSTTTANHNSILDITLTPESKPEDVSFFLCKEVDPSVSESFSFVAIPPPGGQEDSENPWEFPEGFEPLRSEQLAEMNVQSSPIVRNPYMSPLLAPDSMLKGLPPVHLVACHLDPMLDDSVMFAKRLQNIGQPVTLCVVDDLPHGFLSLSQLSRETREAANVCMERIRDVFTMKDPPPEMRMHRKLERTNQKPSATKRVHTQLSQVTVQQEEEEGLSVGGGASVVDEEGLTSFYLPTKAEAEKISA
ncbi:hormone-sensitive lipase isoform X4 [Carassius carassius]|uniref:hormone-sensitive lipase isoform X4 n=1 Tax=Carassius carassius TaxID=217509 RepID=UPI00286944C7|nr:hormone-sensitive lipase isoform X4 [Carassius carassius]